MDSFPKNEREEEKLEQSLFSSVLERYKTEIAEIREAYKLILVILKEYKKIYPSVDIQLNKFYIDLSSLIENAIESIEYEIDSTYDTQSPKSLPDFYINTDIYKNFYLPYHNLYDPQAGKKLDNWDDIQKSLDICYAEIDDAYHRFDAEEVKTLPHQSLFNATSDYLMKLSRSHILECGGIVLDFKKGTIQYKKNPPLEIILDTQLIKLLILLMNNRGEIVEYAVIARELGINSYHSNLTNKDFTDPMRELKKKLGELLKSIGMSDGDFAKLISTQRNIGFKMNEQG